MPVLFIFAGQTGLFSQADSSRGRSLSLEETIKQFTFAGEAPEFRWDPLLGAGVFSIGGRYIAFAAGSAGEEGMILLDGREVLSVFTPYLDWGILRFPESFVTTLRNILGPAVREDTRFRIAAIIVDPGHGGKDPGAIGNPTIGGKAVQVIEKEVNLKVSRLLHARLSTAFPDKQVLLTRQGDTYPTLEERVSIANSAPLRDNEAAIYISIHANYNFNKNARGYEVWYLPPEYRRTVIEEDKYADAADVLPILNAMLEEEFTTESIMMARSIMRQIDAVMGKVIPSRGIKAEDWYVVRNARMPAVLVELGFVSNDEDARILTDDNHLRNYAEALYKGINDFVAAFERSGGFSVIQ
ncbi:MAG: N-acetylmuramoyl-L-alanine amidase [Treponema sp.]|jgi:N-acetylmuramoyl-L-alanine amidase|nr:N-acetylmuramoyl-L-alanine amidase [Treponema sp.]